VSLSDFAQRQRSTENAANPYRGMRAYTKWTRVKKGTAVPGTGRGGVGELDFEAGWDDSLTEGHGPAEFQLGEDGKCYVHGCVDGGAVGSVIFYLPPGLRPPYKRQFKQATTNPAISADVEVDVDGAVRFLWFG